MHCGRLFPVDVCDDLGFTSDNRTYRNLAPFVRQRQPVTYDMDFTTIKRVYSKVAVLLCRSNLIVTRVLTRIGREFRRNGSQTHCLTASSAAGLSSGGPFITFAFSTRPSLPTRTSKLTTPSTRAFNAAAGYTGLTSFIGRFSLLVNGGSALVARCAARRISMDRTESDNKAAMNSSSRTQL